MTNNFLSDIFKIPLSAPSLLVIMFALLFYIFIKLSLESFKQYKTKSSLINSQNKKYSLLFTILAILVFVSSVCFHFYKITEFPAAGHEDDAKIVITAYIIKNTGHDSSNKFIPYFPDLKLFYHNELVDREAQRGIPIYMQVFLQYFMHPGHYSLRLESTLITLFTTLVIIFTLLILDIDFRAAMIFGALFILLPWSRIFARTTPECTSYCFASSCYVLSLFYLIKKKDALSIIFYLTTLSILYISYSPGLLLAPISSILIPLVFRFHSKEYEKLSTVLITTSIILLGVLYFNFNEDAGYQYVISRAQDKIGLIGIKNFNISELTSTFAKNANIYLANYLSYFLPQFLFIAGDGNLRHHTGFGGQLFITLCIAFYVGLFYIIERFKSNLYFKTLLVFTLISCIPAAISIEGYINSIIKLPLHALRSASMLPPVGIILFLGFRQIFHKNKILLIIYLLAISLNVYYFYVDYFNNYSRKLGNNWICDSGLVKTTQKAIKILKKHPEKKLFYFCSPYSIPYNNLYTIGVKHLLKGDGILSNIFEYLEFKNKIPPQKGDIFVIQESFDTFEVLNLNKKIKFILRVQNPSLSNKFGSSLFEIAE
ncbi:MAG: hypothetical protein HY094_08365 [Candidatus Melainabacteria bacterium]|nr:hypothetical protein [Candidatus Melainabacteria bacterium]